MAEPVTDFRLDSGEEVFTFEALLAAQADIDEFELIGRANAGEGSIKGEPTLPLDKGNFSNREVYRRKDTPAEEIFPQTSNSGPIKRGQLGQELIK
jgi:hypothetical protein